MSWPSATPVSYTHLDVYKRQAEAFYLITGAGQEYFGARPGFCIGDRLHAVVFDDRGMADNPRMNLSERLERIIYLGERQDIKAVYSEGIRRI